MATNGFNNEEVPVDVMEDNDDNNILEADAMEYENACEPAVPDENVQHFPEGRDNNENHQIFLQFVPEGMDPPQIPERQGIVDNDRQNNEPMRRVVAINRNISLSGALEFRDENNNIIISLERALEIINAECVRFLRGHQN